MVPDYISAKVMREMKNGCVYPCMGCRSFLTVEDSQRNLTEATSSMDDLIRAL